MCVPGTEQVVRAIASHLAVLRADRVGVEDLANLDKLPPRGAVVMALIPWKEGSGGPARVFATT